METSRERVRKIFDLNSDGAGALWTGHPNGATIPIYAEKWGIEPTAEAIFNHLNDDCRWIMADWGYRHPQGMPMFNPHYGVKKLKSINTDGTFAEAETVADIEKYPWPDPEYCDFTDVYAAIDCFPDKMVFCGMWSPFFHVVADMFGMENYFVNMYANPAIVEAATEKVVDFYAAANDKFFAGLGGRADVMFFGNDFGTQRDLILSPDLFRRFVLPSFKRLIAVGKKYNKKIMLHSCGSIYRIIPDLIDAGIDALHPLQAQAAGMSAAELSQYKNHLAFVGGIDAQSFFVNATPDEIKREVHRVRGLLGPNLIVSPSHEEILPNVPAENVLAMAQAAKE